MALGRANFGQIYQTYFPANELPYLLPGDLPLLNMLMGGNTDGAVSGMETDMPWLYAPKSGTSQSFQVAQQASNNAPQAIRPTVKLSQMYHMLDINDKDQLLSQGTASYADLTRKVLEGARYDFLNNLDQLLHLSGNGIRALVVSTAASGSNTRINLDTQCVETLFEKGDRIFVTTTVPTDGTAPVIGAGPVSVTNIGQNFIIVQGTITASAGNGIAKVGDVMGFTSAMLEPSIIGVDAYNPVADVPDNDNFLGANRSVHRPRLTGYRLDGSKFSIEAGFKRLATLMRAGGVPGGGAVAMANPIVVDSVEDKAASYQRYSQVQLGVFFFDSIAINSPLGRLEMVTDPHQRPLQGRIYVPGALQLQYRDNLPHFATLEGGLTEEFGQNFDGRSKRLRGYMQVRGLEPRKLGNLSLPAIQ